MELLYQTPNLMLKITPKETFAETARKICDVPIMMLTALDIYASGSQASRLFDDRIEKPVDVTEFLYRVKSLLAKGPQSPSLFLV